MASFLCDVALVGAGRAGTSLGRALHDAGWKIVAVAGSSPNSENAARFAAEVDALHIPTAADSIHIADLVILAVPDSAVSDVATSMANSDQVGMARVRAVGHISGALSLAPLNVLEEQGFSTFSFHPAIPLTGRNLAPLDWEGVPVAVAGFGAGLEIANAMASGIGAAAFEVPESRRTLYHAACSMASNALVALESLALVIAESAGIDDPRPILHPLIKATVANLELLDPEDALTGPVARGDLETVKEHLEELRRHVPLALDSYKALALRAVEIAPDLDEAVRSDLEALLTYFEEGDAA